MRNVYLVGMRNFHGAERVFSESGKVLISEEIGLYVVP